MYKQTVVKITS